MNDDTRIGGDKNRFPLTRLSAIVAAGSDNEIERTRAFEILIGAYWKPVYKHIRVKWQKSNEDAKDLTQGFFARSMEKGFLNSYDPAKARFRTFMRICVDGFVANEEKSGARIKRGGSTPTISLDFTVADEELSLEIRDPSVSTDEYFDNEWVRSLFALAIEELYRQLESQGKSLHFKLFQQYDLQDRESGPKITYEQLAGEFSIPVTDVTNHLAFARREFRRIALEHLRALTASEDEFREEAQALFGVRP
jgi:DNA-directed RNA polymerase specialized sigma24 family protein